MEKTFASGHPAGSAKTSPRNHRLGSATAAELENSPGTDRIPAARSASGCAGMTPSLAAIASRLSRPPQASRDSPGTRRFAPTKAKINP